VSCDCESRYEWIELVKAELLLPAAAVADEGPATAGPGGWTIKGPADDEFPSTTMWEETTARGRTARDGAERSRDALRRGSPAGL
jgi:hypothetical protein